MSEDSVIPWRMRVCFMTTFGKKYLYRGKYQKDEELKEKYDRRGTRSQPDTGAGSLKAARIRRFSHDNSKPGSFCGAEYPKMISRDIYEIRSLLEGLCAKKAVTGHHRERIRRIRRESLSYRSFISQKEHYEQILRIRQSFS